MNHMGRVINGEIMASEFVFIGSFDIADIAHHSHFERHDIRGVQLTKS